jgi:hypothetical protein
MNSKKSTRKLKINLHTKIFPSTKKILDETLKAWRKIYTEKFSQTDLLEIAILHLSHQEKEIDINKFYDTYVRK